MKKQRWAGALTAVALLYELRCALKALSQTATGIAPSMLHMGLALDGWAALCPAVVGTRIIGRLDWRGSSRQHGGLIWLLFGLFRGGAHGQNSGVEGRERGCRGCVHLPGPDLSSTLASLASTGQPLTAASIECPKPSTGLAYSLPPSATLPPPPPPSVTPRAWTRHWRMGLA